MKQTDHELSQVLTQSEKIEDFEKIADILGKMGDAKRVQIFWILCHREECVADISEIIGMSSPAVSHHLKILKECNLIHSRREGKEVYYQAADSELARLLHNTTEEIMAISCPDSPIVPKESACACPHTHDIMEHSKESNYSSLAVDIHEYLIAHLDQHITIDMISKHFCVNPTTVKTIFRETFGNSLAAHTKIHRMEKAAELLKEGKLSLSEVAAAVGYQSQSKFTQAFRETYGVLPKNYRKQNNPTG